MPIYEFICTNDDCGLEFQDLISLIEATNDQFCPTCGDLCERLISAPGGFQGLPTPIHSSPPLSEDPGWNREWDSIMGDDNE